MNWTHNLKTESGIALETPWGERRHYQCAEYEGLLGNRKELTWNKETHQHDCCGAKVSWRHHKGCNREMEIT